MIGCYCGVIVKKKRKLKWLHERGCWSQISLIYLFFPQRIWQHFHPLVFLANYTLHSDFWTIQILLCLCWLHTLGHFPLTIKLLGVGPPAFTLQPPSLILMLWAIMVHPPSCNVQPPNMFSIHPATNHLAIIILLSPRATMSSHACLISILPAILSSQLAIISSVGLVWEQLLSSGYLHKDWALTRFVLHTSCGCAGVASPSADVSFLLSWFPHAMLRG